MLGVTVAVWAVPAKTVAFAVPVPTFDAEGHLLSSVRTWDTLQLLKPRVLNTRFRSKWTTAWFAAHGGSPGTSWVSSVTVRLPTLRGFAVVPARFFVVFTLTL